jgi:hypothetical protein
VNGTVGRAYRGVDGPVPQPRRPQRVAPRP